MSVKQAENPISDLNVYVEAVMEKKAFGVCVLDLCGKTSIADAFIIASGKSNRQVTAISDNVCRSLRKKGIKPLHIEGQTQGHWVIMDYGHVIIHIFYDPIRNFYDLEGLWADATRIKTECMLNQEKEAANDQ